MHKQKKLQSKIWFFIPANAEVKVVDITSKGELLFIMQPTREMSIKEIGKAIIKFEKELEKILGEKSG